VNTPVSFLIHKRPSIQVATSHSIFLLNRVEIAAQGAVCRERARFSAQNLYAMKCLYHSSMCMHAYMSGVYDYKFQNFDPHIPFIRVDDTETKPFFVFCYPLFPSLSA